MCEIALEHQRHFCFDLWLEHSAVWDFLTVVQRHVGEQHAEVGRVDAKLLLHRFGGESDLATHEPFAAFQIMIGVGLLDGIGGSDPAVGDFVTNGCYGDTALLSRAKSARDRLDLVGIYVHLVFSTKIRDVRATAQRPRKSGLPSDPGDRKVKGARVCHFRSGLKARHLTKVGSTIGAARFQGALRGSIVRAT